MGRGEREWGKKMGTKKQHAYFVLLNSEHLSEFRFDLKKMKTIEIVKNREEGGRRKED